jgi:hypothetical protein
VGRLKVRASVEIGRYTFASVVDADADQVTLRRIE